MGVDLPLRPVLATLAILSCALVLGRVPQISQRRTAERRSLCLSNGCPQAELAQYGGCSYSKYSSEHSGKRYRIRPYASDERGRTRRTRHTDGCLVLSARKGNFQSVTSCWRRRLLLRIDERGALRVSQPGQLSSIAAKISMSGAHIARIRTEVRPSRCNNKDAFPGCGDRARGSRARRSTRRAPSCSSMPAICCLEEGGLALPIRTLARLAEDQELRRPP